MDTIGKEELTLLEMGEVYQRLIVDTMASKENYVVAGAYQNGGF